MTAELTEVERIARAVWISDAPHVRTEAMWDEITEYAREAPRRRAFAAIYAGRHRPRLEHDHIRAFLDLKWNAGMLPHVYVVLERGQEAWTPGDVYESGPGVVHYYRLRDDGSIGAGHLQHLLTADAVVDTATRLGLDSPP